MIGPTACTPTWFAWSSAIQITIQDSRVQAGLRTRERQAELVARGASRTMQPRHLTGHAVDPVALDGEVGWQWQDYFRVAAMPAAADEQEVPVCWGGCWESLLAIASPNTASPTTSRPAGPEAVPARPAFRAALGLPA